MFLPYMNMHAYTIHAFTLYTGYGGEGGGEGSGWGWGVEGGWVGGKVWGKVGGLDGCRVPVIKSNNYKLYMYFRLRVLYYTFIYTHIVYMLLKVACTYAQLFENSRISKSLIDRFIVPIWELFTLAPVLSHFTYYVIEAKPAYYILLYVKNKIQF